MAQKIVVVRIDRKRWLRGKENSALFIKKGNPNAGKMCCLGFAALACGLKVKDISSRGLPEDVQILKIKESPLFKRFVNPNAWGGFDDKPVTWDLTRTNDDEYLKDSVREKELRRLGRKLGFKFVFFN